MVEAKEIQNIEPYNELFFISCYYNSMFSVLKYYNKSIMPFLVNCISKYIYNGNRQGIFFSVAHYPVIEVDELLRRMGVIIYSKQNNYNIIQDAINSILNNRPVIVTVDCFFMPIRSEFYMKKHAPHAILVYGFSNTTEMFSIIEQKNADSLNYCKTNLGYTDLFNSYKGFLELDNPYLIKTTYCEYDIDKSYDCHRNAINGYQKNYKLNITQKREDIEIGLKFLDSFIKDFELMLVDEFLLRQSIPKLLVGFNDIINTKKFEGYMLNNLFGIEGKLTKLNKEIGANWGLIRSKLIKYMFSSVYKPKEFTDLMNNLQYIYRDECLYLDICCNLINE